MDPGLSLETKIALLDQRMEDLIERLDRFEAMDSRISSLERWRAYLLGAWAVGAAILGFVVAYLVK